MDFIFQKTLVFPTTDYQLEKWTLCELGPGLGSFISVAKNQGHDVHGIEYSDYAVNFIKKTHGIENIQKGTIDSVKKDEFPEFDVFAMFAVIEHLYNPLETLKTINSMIKDNGLLFLSTGVFGSFNQRIAGKKWIILNPDEHLYFFTKNSMEEYLNKAGFELVHMETNGALINDCTQSKILVKAFNNRITRFLKIPQITEKNLWGDEMFLIARKK